MRTNVKIVGTTSDPQRSIFDGAIQSVAIGAGIITDDHAACSYGQPVMVMDGQVYSPFDVKARGWQVVDWDVVYPASSADVFETFRRLMEWPAGLKRGGKTT